MKLPFSLQPGHNYRFDISVRQIPSQVPFGVFSAFHKSVLTPWELNELLTRARNFIHDVKPTPISVLYRNKPSDYFSDIITNRNGVMEVYDKDHSGDPGSPTNGQIQGLFFSTAVNPKTGALPKVSPFGNMRLILPVERFVTDMNNLYFTDFYCHKKKHLVTLVVTRKGSLADNFCASNLIKLPFIPQGNENPFFFRNQITGEHYCSKKVTVEVLFTENVDLVQELRLDKNCLRYVRPTGRGSSRPDSKPKNPNCKLCNLYTQ